jgi:hypothetical protein
MPMVGSTAAIAPAIADAIRAGAPRYSVRDETSGAAAGSALKPDLSRNQGLDRGRFFFVRQIALFLALGREPAAFGGAMAPCLNG